MLEKMTTKPTTQSLSQSKIDQALDALGSKWRYVDGTLQRRWQFDSFDDATDFVNQVFELAKSLDHHPDILFEYTKLTLNLWTHTVGGVTDKDVRLATQLNEL